MRKIQDIAAGFFVLCIVALSVVSILGIWGAFGTDVIWKSFQTLGLVAIVSVVIVIAGKFVGNPNAPDALPVPSPVFKGTRNVTLGVLIISAGLLALVGVLTIWDVITEKEIVHKSLSTLALLAFSSILIVMTCLEREGNSLWKQHGHQLMGGAVLIVILLAWLLASMVF